MAGIPASDHPIPGFQGGPHLGPHCSLFRTMKLCPILKYFEINSTCSLLGSILNLWLKYH